MKNHSIIWIMSGLLVYYFFFIGHWFIWFIGLFLHAFLPIQWDSVQFVGFICQCVFSLDSGIGPGLLVYLVYRFICQCILSLDSAIVSSLLVYFCWLVYFTMHSFTGPWNSVRFIGLVGLSVSAFHHWTAGLCLVYWFIWFIGLFFHGLYWFRWVNQSFEGRL